MELRLADGGSASIVETDGEHVVVLSPVPSPPGSTWKATLVADGSPIAVKVRGCRKDRDAWRIEGRFVSLTRAQREVVLGR